MASKGKQIGLAAGAMLTIIAILGSIKYFQILSFSQHPAPPPDTVTSAKAEAATWPRTLSAVGSLAAIQGVVLSAEEGGKVTNINFDSGTRVDKGAVLVQLDTSVEQANLEASRAMLAQSKSSLQRAELLRAKNANSQADLDSAVATERSASATVDSLSAVIERKKVLAPFSGKTGIRLVNVGQYLNPGTQVVPLFTDDQLYVNFSLPQQNLASLSVGEKVQASVDAYPGQSFAGEITTINPQVDAATRNVDVQATIPNGDQRLRPGMFATVSVVLPQADQVVTIPSTSVVYAPYGNTVYVIEKMKGPDGAEYSGVRQQIVKVGPAQGELISVEGIKAGEEVVTSGGFKLRPNGAVVVNNEVMPGSSTKPTPADT